MRFLLCTAAFSSALFAQSTTFENQPATILSNDKLELVILTQGAGMARLVLKDDPEKMSPLWHPAQTRKFNPGTGHFLCVDGFGPVSSEETAAGFPGHGEAHLQPFAASGSGADLTLTASLPLAQEKVVRTFHLASGEQVIYVDTELESLTAFDRPVQWAEHATVGSPFLQPGVTVVDMSAQRAQTRPYPKQTGARGLPHRLPPGQDFTWPLAPGVDGKPVDMRLTPSHLDSGDHTASLMDPSRELEWVTALNPEKHLLLGYVFRRADFPWVQTWENYPSTGVLARGMEFSTQAYDVPRREVVTQGRMFDTPLYRWLPAASKIQSRFLMFYTRVPDGFSGIEDVRLENGQLSVRSRAGKLVTLKTSRTL